nr:hypothetical protein [uncultured Desulfobulbus sp.]
MQVPSATLPTLTSGSVLRSAQQQPLLAADLISKTVESLAQVQSMPAPAQTAVQTGYSKATRIDVTA